MFQHVSTLLSAFMPQQCLLCRSSHSHSAALCPSCRPYLPWNKTACRCCAMPLSGPAELCGQCLQQRPVFTSSIAPLLYAHPVDYLIKQIKFHDNLAAARGLGMLLAEAILDESQPQADVIIPVPLHHSRLRQRGFNQAQEIARPLSSMLDRGRAISCAWLKPRWRRRLWCSGTGMITSACGCDSSRMASASNMPSPRAAARLS